jgi:hypothetical protein
MTPSEVLRQHQELCDELYQVALEENRCLRQNQEVVDLGLIARKRSLNDRLDRSLEALRALPAVPARDTEAAAQVEKARSRILQILQLDKENEQLLLRLGAGPAKAPNSGVSGALLSKIYSRRS